MHVSGLMNVRHVTRVSQPASRQRAQTKAVKCLPVRSLVQRYSTTLVVATPSFSKHSLQMSGWFAMGVISEQWGQSPLAKIWVLIASRTPWSSRSRSN